MLTRTPLRYASHYAHPTAVEFLLAKGATISGNPSSGWGFDITARRIGFADEVLREEERKAQVLKLLADAEAKEQKSQEQTTAPMRSYPAAARSPLGAPAELAVAASGSTQPPQQPNTQPRTARLEIPGNTPSELDTRIRSLSTNSRSTPDEPRSAYPAPSHIANTYGFDPFPQQRASSEGARPGSATPTPRPDLKVKVHLGPDGMWRLNPEPSTHVADGATSIYEIGS